MWLRNYYNALTAFIYSDDTLTSTTAPTAYTPPIMVQNLNGSYSQCLFGNKSFADTNYSTMPLLHLLTCGKFSLGLKTSNSTSDSYASGLYLMVGSGSTPATYDDYCLEALITSGVSIVSSSGTLKKATDITGSNISSTRSFTINNTSASNITISEIGLVSGIGAPVTGGNGQQCMFYREVLDEPVTLAPSESMILSFDRSGTIYNYTPYN